MNRRVFDDERLADWVDDQLDEVQRERFEAELRVNPELRRAAEEYRRTVESVRAALRGGDGVSAGFTDRVMQGVESQKRARRFRLVPLLGSAIAAGLLAGLWLFVRDFASTTSTGRDVANLSRQDGDDRVESDREVSEFKSPQPERAGESLVADPRSEEAKSDESSAADRRKTIQPTTDPLGAKIAVTEPPGDKAADQKAAGVSSLDDLSGFSAGAKVSDPGVRLGSARSVDAHSVDAHSGEPSTSVPDKDLAEKLHVGAVDPRARETQSAVEDLARNRIQPVVTSTGDESRAKELGDARRLAEPGAAGGPPTGAPAATRPAADSAIVPGKDPRDALQPDSQSVPDAGSLVYLVELPATTAAEVDRAADLLAASSSGPDQFAQWSIAFVQQPVAELGRALSNVMPPGIRRLQVGLAKAPEGAVAGGADAGRADTEPDTNLGFGVNYRLAMGAYVPEPGDQVFRLDGDPAQNNEYLRAFAPQVKSQQGRILVQRAFGLVGRVIDTPFADHAPESGPEASGRDVAEGKVVPPAQSAAPSAKARGAPSRGALPATPAPEHERAQQQAAARDDKPASPAPQAQDSMGSTWIVLRRRLAPQPAGASVPAAEKPVEESSKRR